MKFADDWLPAQPGTDGALAMAMGHVMLKEFWVDRPVPRFEDYGKRFTDLPLLVALEERDGVHVPGRFLMAADIGDESEHADWKPVAARRRHRRAGGAERLGRLPLRRAGQGPLEPRASARSIPCSPCTAVTSRRSRSRCRASTSATGPAARVMRRGVPAIRVGGRLVTTVLDLMLATYGVARDGLPGEWPEGYDDASAAVHAGVAGGDHRPSTAGWRSRSRASSRATRRSAAGAR